MLACHWHMRARYSQPLSALRPLQKSTLPSPFLCRPLPQPSQRAHAHADSAARGGCARRGDFGRLGHGDCNDVFIPQTISALTGRNVVKMACGDTHTLAVTSAGELLSFGRNQNGQLGLGSTQDAIVPQPVEALKVPLLLLLSSVCHMPCMPMLRCQCRCLCMSLS